MKNKLYIVLIATITILFTSINIYSSNSSFLSNKFNKSIYSELINTDNHFYLADGTNFDNFKHINKINVKQTKVDLDTADYTLKLWENTNGDVLITLKLKNKEQNIKISIWNMLGKSILNDFEGKYTDLDENHLINNSSLLSRGAYILRIQGDKLKIDLKFIKSK